MTAPVQQDEPAYEVLFPKGACASIVGELSAWTPLHTILASARYVENRPIPGDALEGTLFLPFADEGGVFQRIAIEALGWLMASYRVPEPKIILARSVDRQIRDETVAFLKELHFRPTIRVGPPGVVQGIEPDKHVFVVDDHPAMIEMIQNPLRCLMSRLTDGYELASDSYKLRSKYLETTGGAPTVYHRPYADSRLSALLEAVCFYAFGLPIGPAWASPGNAQPVTNYRSVNVCAAPPIDQRMLDAARDGMAVMLNDLR